MGCIAGKINTLPTRPKFTKLSYISSELSPLGKEESELWIIVTWTQTKAPFKDRPSNFTD